MGGRSQQQCLGCLHRLPASFKFSIVRVEFLPTKRAYFPKLNPRGRVKFSGECLLLHSSASAKVKTKSRKGPVSLYSHGPFSCHVVRVMENCKKVKPTFGVCLLFYVWSISRISQHLTIGETVVHSTFIRWTKSRSVVSVWFGASKRSNKKVKEEQQPKFILSVLGNQRMQARIQQKQSM